jgi:hypothetical protein
MTDYWATNNIFEQWFTINQLIECNIRKILIWPAHLLLMVFFGVVAQAPLLLIR